MSELLLETENERHYLALSLFSRGAHSHLDNARIPLTWISRFQDYSFRDERSEQPSWVNDGAFRWNERFIEKEGHIGIESRGTESRSILATTVSKLPTHSLLAFASDKQHLGTLLELLSQYRVRSLSRPMVVPSLVAGVSTSALPAEVNPSYGHVHVGTSPEPLFDRADRSCSLFETV